MSPIENHRLPSCCASPIAKAVKSAPELWPTLTHRKPERVEALQRALKGEFDGLGGDPTSGEIFAVLFALKHLADQVGLGRILRGSGQGRLALLLVFSRIAHGGSRLSA
nr:hypothetical protein [Gammaproteobacteria bacterium]